MPRNFFFIAFLVSVAAFSQSNLSVGQWANHFPLMKTTNLTKGNGMLWAGCDYGMFKFDMTDESLETFRTYESFANFEIANLAFNAQTKSFIISYKTGDIDVVDASNNVTTMSQIRRSLLLGDKFAYHLHNYNNLCFVSADIGLVVIDVSAKKVLETYSNVSPNAQRTSAFNSAILNDTLYLTERNGRLIFVPYRNNINKMDFQNWRVLSSQNGVDEPVNFVCTIEGKLLALTNTVKLLRKNGNMFSMTGYVAPGGSNIRKVKTLSNQTLAIIFNNQIDVVNSSGEVLKTINRGDVTDIEFEGNTYYLTTQEKGIIKHVNNQFSNPIFPNSPFNLSFGRAHFDEGTMFLFPNAIAVRSGSVGVFPLVLTTFDGKEWVNISRESHPTFQFNNAFFGSVIGDSLFFSNFNGLGVVHKRTFQGRNISQQSPPFNNTGVPNNSPFYVSAVKKDNANNLFVTGFLPGLAILPIFHKRNPRTGNWTSTSIPFTGGRIIVDMTLDNSNNKWMYASHIAREASGIFINGEGLFVYNELTGAAKRLTTEQGNGNLTSTKIFSIETARNGEIWVGTDNGISVFFNPERVLASNTGWDASVPVYDSRALMREKTVTAIKADAADRKWIGTQTEGVWLFSADGSDLVYNFNTSNSPLPSNNIIEIEINPRNGEVIFSTEKGIAIFREGVASPEENTGSVEIFPNPVHENFSGRISIGSLGEDAVVKITDVSGKLIHQTQALGATAFWDGNDLSGNRVKSGVYLVFSSTKSGEEKLVGKFAILR